MATEVTHACPPSGSGLTPCCGRTPFELPRRDRITLDAALVTCSKIDDADRAAREEARRAE